jgi:Acetyltransferases
MRGTAPVQSMLLKDERKRMKVIRSLEQYEGLLQEARAKHTKVISNIFFFKNEIFRFIQKGNLYYDYIDAGLLFFEKHQNCYQMYFYLVPSVQFGLSHFDHPVRIDLISDKNSINPYESIFLDLGFQKQGSFQRMKHELNNLTFIDGHNQIEYAQISDIKNIMDLWTGHLQRDKFILPNEDELRQNILDNEIFCMRVDGKFASVFHIVFKNQTALIQLLVIDPDFRGLSFAKGLYKNIINLSLRNNVHANYLWVDEKNTPAIALYKSLGFQFDFRKVDKLLLIN